MRSGFALRALLLPLFFSLQCAATLAELRVTVSPAGNGSGGETIRADVKFTRFAQPAGPGGNDGKLRLRFTNPEGDIMDFVLAPRGSGGDAAALFPAGSYAIDGAQSTFDAALRVMSGGTSRVVQVSAAGDYANSIDIQSISFDSAGVLLSIAATFQCKLAQGSEPVGNGDGRMNVN